MSVDWQEILAEVANEINRIMDSIDDPPTTPWVLPLLTARLLPVLKALVEKWDHDTFLDGPTFKQFEVHREDCRRCQIEAAVNAIPAPIENREQKAMRLARESGKTVHASDCATSCAPAEEPGPCDCNELQPAPASLRESVLKEAELWDSNTGEITRTWKQARLAALRAERQKS